VTGDSWGRRRSCGRAGCAFRARRVFPIGAGKLLELWKEQERSGGRPAGVVSPRRASCELSEFVQQRTAHGSVVIVTRIGCVVVCGLFKSESHTACHTAFQTIHVHISTSLLAPATVRADRTGRQVTISRVLVVRPVGLSLGVPSTDRKLSTSSLEGKGSYSKEKLLRAYRNRIPFS
jgi:hypothetical protein